MFPHQILVADLKVTKRHELLTAATIIFVACSRGAQRNRGVRRFASAPDPHLNSRFSYFAGTLNLTRELK